MKLRHKAKIYLDDGTIVLRNVYSDYVSNVNPVYVRYNGIHYFVSQHEDGFKLGRKYF